MRNAFHNYFFKVFTAEQRVRRQFCYTVGNNQTRYIFAAVENPAETGDG